MARKWTKAQRQAQSERLKTYWRRVHLIEETQKVDMQRARDFYSRGLFRGVREEVHQRVADRYKAKRDSKGRLYVERTTPSGKKQRVRQEAVQRSLAQSTYEALVRRLSIHTGWKRADVRNYLSAYPQWRDGISPLFRLAESGFEDEDDAEDYDEEY